MQEITALLRAWRDGDPEALQYLMPLVYEELRQIARRHLSEERPGHTLQTTALVNEAYLRLVNLKAVDWRDRAHFFSYVASVMRHVLVDFARARQYQKRGGGKLHKTLGEADVLVKEESYALEDVLALHLEFRQKSGKPTIGSLKKRKLARSSVDGHQHT
jgi:RNA polymerase sigma factor (TIGR02999 family)